MEANLLNKYIKQEFSYSTANRLINSDFSLEAVAMDFKNTARKFFTSAEDDGREEKYLCLIDISEPTRLLSVSYAVFRLKTKRIGVHAHT